MFITKKKVVFSSHPLLQGRCCRVLPPGICLMDILPCAHLPDGCPPKRSARSLLRSRSGPAPCTLGADSVQAARPCSATGRRTNKRRASPCGNALRHAIGSSLCRLMGHCFVLLSVLPFFSLFSGLGSNTRCDSLNLPVFWSMSISFTSISSPSLMPASATVSNRFQAISEM